MATTIYATAALLQTRLDPREDTWTADEQTMQTAALNAASRMIDQYCRRFFGQSDSEARYFTARDAFCLTVPDLVSVSEVATDTSDDGTYDTTWTSGEFMLWPYNAASEQPAKPYTKIKVDTRSGSALETFPLGTEKAVKVTGVWGWPSIPSDIENVCLLEAMRILRQNDSPTGVISNSDQGTGTIVPELHPSSRIILASYRRMGRLDG